MTKPIDAVWPFPSNIPKYPEKPSAPPIEDGEDQEADTGRKPGEDESAAAFIKQRD